MEAPQKIYVHETSAAMLKEKLPYHIEYIRKDTLLEWLESQKELFKQAADGSSDSGYFISKVKFAQSVIDKINSL